MGKLLIMLLGVATIIAGVMIMRQSSAGYGTTTIFVGLGLMVWSLAISDKPPRPTPNGTPKPERGSSTPSPPVNDIREDVKRVLMALAATQGRQRCNLLSKYKEVLPTSLNGSEVNALLAGLTGGNRVRGVSLLAYKIKPNEELSREERQSILYTLTGQHLEKASNALISNSVSPCKTSPSAQSSSTDHAHRARR